MRDSVKKYYDAAKEDLVFQGTLKTNGEKDYKPKWHWGTTEKHMFTAVYIGYLHGIGEYIEFKAKLG